MLLIVVILPTTNVKNITCYASITNLKNEGQSEMVYGKTDTRSEKVPSAKSINESGYDTKKFKNAVTLIFGCLLFEFIYIFNNC